MTDIPPVDKPTLDKLMEWTEGYLRHKGAMEVIPDDEKREHNFALDLWTGFQSVLAELKRRRAEDPTEDEQGPMWIPTLQVERLMRDIKAHTNDKVEIDRKTLEGLLHDSLLWRKDRQERDFHQHTSVRLSAVNAQRVQQLQELLDSWSLLDSRSQSQDPEPSPLSGNPTYNGPHGFRTGKLRADAIQAYVSQFAPNKQPSKREAFADGWDACYMQRPPRARVGTLEIGVTEDHREVVINAPFTPDNGTGFVHFAFTPLQAIAAGELLIKKGREASHDVTKEQQALELWRKAIIADGTKSAEEARSTTWEELPEDMREWYLDKIK